MTDLWLELSLSDGICFGNGLLSARAKPASRECFHMILFRSRGRYLENFHFRTVQALCLT